MICIKSHFKYNRILLLSIGLWPYERTRLVQFQTILFFGILISSIIYQLATLVFTKCTPALVINVLSITLCFSTAVILYNSFWINAHAIKWLLDELQRICNDLKDENEIAIITKYGYIAKRFTILVMLLHACNVSTSLLLTFLLHLFNTVFVTDVMESKSHRIVQKVIPTFIIGRESYMYLIFLYFLGGICIGGTTLVATGMMLIAYLKHACGMFRIASYRIEKAMMINTSILKNNLENEIRTYKEIIHAVDIHRKAVKFSTLTFSNFKGSLFFLIVVNVMCLSFNLYRISEMLREGDIEQCYIHFVLTIGFFTFLFLANYVGQEITDYNDHVFFTAYNVRWHVTSLHIQRLILFLLQNGKVFRLSVGVFPFSIEFFATLTKASISYFTVVYSMQQ